MGRRLRDPEARRQCPPGATADQHVDDGREQRLIRRVLRPATLRPHLGRWDQRLSDLPQPVRNNPTPRTPPHERSNDRQPHRTRSKTRILDPEEGLAEELDTRYSSLKHAVKNGIPGSRDKIREEFESLDKEGTFSGTKTRFVLNRMSELGDDYAVSWCLESLERTPHAVTEVFHYLAVTGRSREREITGRLARFIDRGTSASFPFTEQRILRYFLSTQDSPAKTKEAAWMVLEDHNRQDYSREVAARCAGRHASLAESRILRNRFEREQIPAVRRALLVGLYESGHLTSDYLSEVKDAYAHLLWTCKFLATEPDIALPKIG